MKEDLITRYLDGELSPEEHEEFERQLAASPELQKEVEKLLELDAITSVAADEVEPKWRVARASARESAAARWFGGRKLAWAAVVGVGAVAVATPLIVVGPQQPTLELEVVASEVQRGGSIHPGDRIELVGHAGTANMELRVYHNEALVRRCPSEVDVCSERDGALQTELDAKVGVYEILFMTSDTPIPEPESSFRMDLINANAAGVAVERRRAEVW